MKNVIIGLDLDGVTLDYTSALRAAASRQLGVPESELPEPTSYSFVQSGWGFDSEAHFAEVHGNAVDTEELYTNLDPIPGSPEALQKLSAMGYHIRVITSRFVNHGQHAKVLTQTAENLDRLGIPYNDIVFTARKADIFADVYIDDSPSNVVSLREKTGRPVLVFTAPYNGDMPAPRADNWDDVTDYITRNFPLEEKQEVAPLETPAMFAV